MNRRLDTSLLLCVVGLFGLGLVQVYSSSFIFATEAYSDGLFFFKRQVIFVAFALVVLLGTAHVPWRWFEKLGWTCWVVASLLVAVTFIPGVGIRVGGALRWIGTPFGFRFQPGEFLNVSFSLFFATLLCHFQALRLANENQQLFTAPVREKLKSPGRWLLFCVFFLTVPLLMLLKQPDFGTFSIIIFVLGALLFAFGLKWRYILVSSAVALPVFYFLVMSVPYRRNRVLAFLDPWSDPTQKGFQVIQSMLSFHSGGIFGAGLGQGQGKLFFLPEAHTDFTLSVFAEEMGLVGFVILFLIYGFLVLKGFQICMQSENLFKRAVALGLSVTFALCVFVNAGVAMGLLPTKGLTLPFLSYGGSSLVNLAFLFGLLLNIERNNKLKPVQARRSQRE